MTMSGEKNFDRSTLEHALAELVGERLQPAAPSKSSSMAFSLAP
jgi:hypothetical protein